MCNIDIVFYLMYNIFSKIYFKKEERIWVKVINFSI